MASLICLSGYYGTTIPFNVSCTRGDGSIPNLTTATIWCTFKASVSDTDPGLIQKTLGSGIVATNLANGQFQVVVNPTDFVQTGYTKVISVDVKIKEANGNEWIAAAGTLTLSQPPTARTS